MSWNLPPGCSNYSIEENAGAFDICDVCGLQVDSCICPECPHFKCHGNIECYRMRHLELSKEQISSREKVARERNFPVALEHEPN